MKKSQKMIEQLNLQMRQKGYRESNLRNLLLSFLLENKSSSSVPEILRYFAEKCGFQPNKTSVYREIESLLKEGFLREIYLDKVKSYEIKLNNEHYHLVCEGCSRVVCIDLPDKELVTLFNTYH